MLILKSSHAIKVLVVLVLGVLYNYENGPLAPKVSLHIIIFVRKRDVRKKCSSTCMNCPKKAVHREQMTKFDTTLKDTNFLAHFLGHLNK